LAIQRVVGIEVPAEGILMNLGAALRQRRNQRNADAATRITEQLIWPEI
jgi:hypothetical protein